MQRRLRRALDHLGAIVAVLQLRWFLRRARRAGRDVTVLDIDNTLADTWPTLVATAGAAPRRSRRGELVRLRGLEPLPGMKAAAYDAAIERGDAVAFLSHRNWWEWPVTRRWLRDHGYAVGPSQLVLVASPHDKVAHLRRCAARVGAVTYWDDLSHSHETGTVQILDEVVEQVLGLGVVHHGSPEIAAVVAAAEGDPGDRHRRG